METSEMKYDLSTVTICEKLTTDVMGNLESAFSRSKFAGELAYCWFVVITAQITVLILLRLKASP